MAVTISPYNHTMALLMGQQVNLDTLRIKLLNQYAVFDATDMTTSDVTGAGAFEVDGNGWTAGGVYIDSAYLTVTTANTNGAVIDFADVSVDASGGAIGPVEGALIEDATSGKPLWFIDFGEAKTAGSGTPFRINPNASGFISSAWVGV